jgi:hypothetical protein
MLLRPPQGLVSAISICLGTLLGCSRRLNLPLEVAHMLTYLDDIANADNIYSLVRKLNNLPEYGYVLVRVQTIFSTLSSGLQ